MKIALDVDDVLADLHPTWLERCNKEAGTRFVIEDMQQWDFWRDFGWSEEFIYKHLRADIYAEVLPCAGALSVVNALRARGDEIVYVTSCHTIDMWTAKFQWLQEYGFYAVGDQAFPVGPWSFYKSKREVGAAQEIRWLVDDNVDNCESWAGHAMLLTRPHNRNYTYCGKRLRKFEDLLLEVKGMEYQTVHSPVMLASPFVGMPVDRSQEPEIWIDERIIQEAVEFAEGSKPTNPKDAIGSDKLPLSLWPATATVEGSLAMLEGALKYGRSNFRAIGVRATIYADAAMRHIAAWMEGEDKAPDSGISHLGHALACIAIVVDAREAGKLTDDRNIAGGYHSMVERLTPEVKRLKEKYADRSPRHYTINDVEVL